MNACIRTHSPTDQCVAYRRDGRAASLNPSPIFKEVASFGEGTYDATLGPWETEIGVPRLHASFTIAFPRSGPPLQCLCSAIPGPDESIDFPVQAFNQRRKAEDPPQVRPLDSRCRTMFFQQG